MEHSPTFAMTLTEEEQIPKGWSSERVVAVSKYSNRSRHAIASTTSLFPFSSGRTLPSKWDNAERWISSPIFGQDGSFSSKSLQVTQSERRAKSKSGPLGPQLIGNYGSFSPLMPVVYGAGSMAADSPLFGTSNSSYGRRRSCPGQSEEDLACTREWLKMLNEPPQEEKADESKEAEKQVTRVISRRDMGTQMVPSESSSTISNEQTEMDAVMKDVKVDKEDTCQIRRQFKQNSDRRSNCSHSDSNNDSSRLQTSTSKVQREEAKINEWESRQRANADAAIRKLEMKLEKKRKRSMERIMKKLRRAELKAEKMRASVSENNGSGHWVCRKSNQSIACLCLRFRMSFIGNCLACR